MTADVFAARLDGVTEALLQRWPESRLEPSLDRIRRLTELLGFPQRAFSTAHLTGTNGKTSTARILAAVLSTHGRRTGRFTSPHLESVTERIAIDGTSIDATSFIRTYDAVAPVAARVDCELGRLPFFEMTVAMAYLAFAEAAIDSAVVEVGMGGAWDATNVVDAQVAVILPIGLDHADYLGGTPALIAAEKAGVMKPRARAVIARQESEVHAVLAAHAAAIGTTTLWEGEDFEIVERRATSTGQLVSVQGSYARYDDLALPLHGPHQAQNAAVALAAAEACLAQPLDEAAVRTALARVTSPGRLEVLRDDPPVLLDAAHNPHGAAATAAALDELLGGSTPVVGVVGVMADKDARGILEVLGPRLAHVVCTEAGTDRALPAAALGEVANDALGARRVTVEPAVSAALERAIARADASHGTVLVVGSVHLAGTVRTLLPGRSRRAT